MRKEERKGFSVSWKDWNPFFYLPFSLVTETERDRWQLPKESSVSVSVGKWNKENGFLSFYSFTWSFGKCGRLNFLATLFASFWSLFKPRWERDRHKEKRVAKKNGLRTFPSCSFISGSFHFLFSFAPFLFLFPGFSFMKEKRKGKKKMGERWNRMKNKPRDPA